MLHDRHPQGDLEIVEDMLGVRPHVPLKIADVPATIGHEGDLTVHPDALLQQQFMKATTRPVVMSDHEAEPASCLANFAFLARRSEARRVGTRGVRSFRYRWSPYH